MLSMYISLYTIAILVITRVNAHLAAWHIGMYCINGNQTEDDENAFAPINPLFNLPKKDWWFHHVDRCDTFPPKPGDFLELPAGGEFTVEIANNRAVTTLSYDGQYTSEWVDGKPHPDNFQNSTQCITDPNIHTINETMAAGTAFAISYQSSLQNVMPENLVVFTVRYHTPWKRVTTYSVPAALPACPSDGCTCAVSATRDSNPVDINSNNKWGWVPNGCGEPNIYLQGFKCKVTGATSSAPVAAAKPPVWCENDLSKCVQGAKQMIYWNQMEGNNIKVSGNDLAGMPKSPAYNNKCGFSDGAQNDIFAGMETKRDEGTQRGTKSALKWWNGPTEGKRSSSSIYVKSITSRISG